MSILEKIIAHKRKEVEQQKASIPMKELEQSNLFQAPRYSISEFLKRPDKSGIIAEFKRKSPSKGVINGNAEVGPVTAGYAKAGASALSVLTDGEFFGGSIEDLQQARRANEIPILRKDFTVSEYQIVEARSIGADAILLIAAALGKDELKTLSAFAKKLGLEVLLEVHSEEELYPALEAGADLIGVNNRNLQTFETTLEVSRKLIEKIPNNFTAVSESGISSPGAILGLKQIGYQGFLIGENFMKIADPGGEANRFIQKLTQLQKEQGHAQTDA